MTFGSGGISRLTWKARRLFWVTRLLTTSIYLHTSEEQCRSIRRSINTDGADNVIDLRERQQRVKTRGIASGQA